MTTMTTMTTGIIGGGYVGSNLAKAAIVHGYGAVLSNSRGPDSLADLVCELGPRTSAATPAEAAAAGDESWRIDAGQPAFVVRQNLAELKANVAKAKRGE
jgi:pyrroline-5-carboxylate reductase